LKEKQLDTKKCNKLKEKKQKDATYHTRYAARPAAHDRAASSAHVKAARCNMQAYGKEKTVHDAKSDG
jgi:hypothetical protein